MKNENYTIGNRTRDLLASSAVPEPTALSRTSHQCVLTLKHTTHFKLHSPKTPFVALRNRFSTQFFNRNTQIFGQWSSITNISWIYKNFFHRHEHTQNNTLSIGANCVVLGIYGRWKTFLYINAADISHNSFVIVGSYFNQVSYLMSNKTKR